jgi:hypothetical protein
MAKIFVSYKRKDKEKILSVVNRIQKELNVECWMDISGIESNAQFVSVIIRAIDEAEIILFMYSKSHKSIQNYENDWTIRELNYAQERNKRIVFVNIDGTELISWFVFMFPKKQQVNAQSNEEIAKLIKDIGHWLKIDKKPSLPRMELAYSKEEFTSLVKKGNMGSASQPFLLAVQETFFITGRGLVVTGMVESGTLRVGDSLSVIGFGKNISTVCTRLEKYRKLIDVAHPGDTIGLTLRGLDKSDVSIGQVVSQPSSISESNTLYCDCLFFSDMKVRNSGFETTSDQPLTFCIRTAEVAGKLVLPNGINHISPNAYIPVKAVLNNFVPINKGLVFAIRIKNKTVGVGIVKHT